jgi:hypothetical protein
VRCPPFVSARVATSPFTSPIVSGAAIVALGFELQSAARATASASDNRTDLDIVDLGEA